MMEHSGWIIRTMYYEDRTGPQVQEILDGINKQTFADVIANQPFITKQPTVDNKALWSGYVTYKINPSMQEALIQKVPTKTEIEAGKQEMGERFVKATSGVKINL